MWPVPGTGYQLNSESIYIIIINLFFTEPFCWEHSPDANCYFLHDPCPPGLEDCRKSYVCPVSTNKCCCPKSGPPSVPPTGPTPPPTSKPSLYYVCQFLQYIDLVYTKTVFFGRSDWLLNQWISCTIHWFTSSSSERATPNSRRLRAKCFPGLLP